MIGWERASLWRAGKRREEISVGRRERRGGGGRGREVERWVGGEGRRKEEGEERW